MKKVAIVGAGEIGAFIAGRLSAEQFEVTVIDHNPVVLANGAFENTLTELSSLTLRQGRGTPVSEQTLLAAIAAGWALDIAPDLITAGIETFDANLSPARPTVGFAYAR